jgi:hypothetical protein
MEPTCGYGLYPGTTELGLRKEDPMATRWKTLALNALLLLPASTGALAQTAGSPAPSTEPTTRGIGAWITGHPVTDFFVVLAIIVLIAAAYMMRQRSRA